MCVPVRVLMAVVTAAVLTACGSAAAPTAGSRPRQHTGSHLTSAGRSGPPAGSRAEARALARQMLSRLRLPAGADRLPWTSLPASLREPALWAGARAALDVRRLFAAPQPMATVAASLTARVPAGFGPASTGELGGPAGVTFMQVGYQARSVPAGVYMAQLVLTVAPATSGGSLVRADAQVIWYPSRTAAEYIDPARYHVLDISVTTYNARLHTVDKVVTSQAVIAKLAAALDSSRVEPVRVLSCPAAFAYYRLAFAVSARAAPAVVVTATRWPCEGAQIRVGGRAQPPLQNENAVVDAADRLLGVTPGPTS